MFLRTQLLSCLLLATLFSSHSLADSAFDVIPENAVAAIAINNLGELKAKGTKLVAETKLDVGIKPSEAFDWVYSQLGVTGAVDEKGSAAVVIAGCMPKKTRGWGPLEYLVGVIPFKDRDTIAARFGFKKGELKPDTITKSSKSRHGLEYFYVRGNHLLLGSKKEAVLDVAHAKPLSSRLSKPQRRMSDADIVLHVNIEALGDDLSSEVRQIRRDLTAVCKTDEERAAVVPLLDAVEDFGTATLAVHIDDGVRLGVIATLKKDARPSSRHALAKLRGGDGSSDLSGLPVGRVLSAFAVRSDGSINGQMTKVLMHVVTRGFLGSLFGGHRLPSPNITSTNEQSYFVGVFTQVWHRLDGAKVGVYQNPDPARQGMFSVVAIFDTKDSDEFLKEMKELARFSDPKGFGLTDGKPKSDDEAEIKRLIALCGDDSFRKREAATLKLELIGLAARPYLKDVLESKDPEIRYRAQVVKAHIDRMEKESRAQLLVEIPAKLVKPSFAYFPAYERRDGRPVDVIGCKLSDEEAPAAIQLRKYFGDSWNKIRVARHGKQLIVLFGSNVDLFDKAVGNVVAGRPGIAKSKMMAGYARRSMPRRKAEVHFSIKDVLPLAAAADPKKAADASGEQSPTSLSVSIEKDHVQLDLWLPNSEIKAMSAADKRWFHIF